MPSKAIPAGITMKGEGGMGRRVLGIGTMAVILVVMAALPGLSAASPAIKWTYHVGDAYLASLDPTFSPDVAMASNGDTFTLTGTGTYNPGGPATGGGTFVHADPSGATRHFGTWTAVNVLSYTDFGNGVVNGFPRSFHGGILVLAVTIAPTDVPGLVRSGTLTITCVIGDSVPAGAEEGFTAAIPGVITFGEPVSGNTLFVLTPK